jgi:hypothetical protein
MHCSASVLQFETAVPEVRVLEGFSAYSYEKASKPAVNKCAPHEYSVRTLDDLVRSVFAWFKAQPEEGKHVLDVLEGQHVHDEDQAA